MKLRLALLSVAFAALVLGAPRAGAEGPEHPLITTISGKNISLFEQFKDACGVAVDTKGNVYIADYYQNRILIFDDKGVLLTKILNVEPPPGEGQAPLDGPCDLAVDNAGNLYVNNWHRDVIKFTPSAFPPTSATNYGVGSVVDSNYPTSVAVDAATGDVFSDDRTYIAEYDSPVLPNDEPAQKIGLGTLGNGYGVSVSAGLVYVADAASNTVKIYEPAIDPVVPVRALGGAGTPQGAFYLTDADIAVDPSDGHLYVTDNLKPGFEIPELAVDELSAKGLYRGRLPVPKSEGSRTLKVDAIPSGVAIGADGKIYVTSGNYEDAEVVVFGPAPPTATQILTVKKTGAGSGTVARVPSGWLRCGAACEGEFNQGAPVQLAALPDPHNRLVAWSGCELEPSPSACFVTMGTDRVVGAEFEPIPQQALSVTKTGGGSGDIVSSPAGIDCGAACESGFDEASTVTLTASAAGGSGLAGWGGCDAEPTPNTCTVTMSGARSVTAEFEPLPQPPPPPAQPPAQRTLSLSLAGIGAASGAVVSEPAGIDCGGVCARVFDQGSTITLHARPTRGSSFLGWGGCDTPVGDRCSLTLGVDRTVVAVFAPGRPGPLRPRRLEVSGATATLTVSVPAAGTLTAAGVGLRPTTALPLAAGKVTLRLRLSGAGLRALHEARDHRLAIPVVLALVPFDGGERVVTMKRIVFGPRGRAG
jgi:hypothetical protein